MIKGKIDECDSIVFKFHMEKYVINKVKDMRQTRGNTCSLHHKLMANIYNIVYVYILKL